MTQPYDQRFADLRRLASIEASLSQLAFLPNDAGIAIRKRELNRERTEIAARLNHKT
jgi:hypothetical protein